MHASVQSRFAPILYVLIFFAGFLTAQIWFNQKAYTEELPPLLSALSAVALVWLAWAFVSARSKAKAGKVLPRKNDTERKHTPRPARFFATLGTQAANARPAGQKPR